MRAQYPQLFELGMNFEDEILLRGESCNILNYTMTVLSHVLSIIKVNVYFFGNKIMLKIK